MDRNIGGGTNTTGPKGKWAEMDEYSPPAKINPRTTARQVQPPCYPYEEKKGT